MLAQIPRLADYDVSPDNGFLPSEPPLERLADGYYDVWETLFQSLQALVLSKRLRGLVERMPVLSTEYLRTEAEWRRAYMVLAFLTHAYVWGGETPSERVPPPISIPFLQTCEHLELPPVATYAGVVLWNWKPIFATEPVDSLENIATLQTFTGSLDESWFYLVSVAIEARAAPIIPIMLDAIAAARRNDAKTVTECLRAFAERLDELGTLLQRMYENCDPHVFYHRIRPFLAGSKNMVDAGLPNGVIFDVGTGTESYVQYSGGSNAQSSIIQFFDIVLGVEHRPTGERPPTDASDSEGTAPPAPRHNFIKDMRTYMPGPHRRFLEQLDKVANIRDFVVRHRADRALSTAFDACLAMLRAFRDKHLQIVSRYIIIKSHEARSRARSNSTSTSTTPSPSAPPPQPRRTNIATGSSSSAATTATKKNLRGTGGTALIPFLKQARDETGEPAIDAWARRLLNNGPSSSGSSPSTYSTYSTSSMLGAGVARLNKMEEHASGEVEIVGLAGTWSVDDSEGGICHW